MRTPRERISNLQYHRVHCVFRDGVQHALGLTGGVGNVPTLQHGEEKDGVLLEAKTGALTQLVGSIGALLCIHVCNM